MTMSSIWFGKKSQNNIDYKSRLEYKLYLARENPEPVFDLSECNLKAVPSGIFSLCKVFRKEKLSLQINQLTSLSSGGKLADLCLLTELELQFNHFSTLPEEIRMLENLQELNVSHNKLRKLPEGIGRLKKLRVLNCAFNDLRELPSAMGEMLALVHLDLRDNHNLRHLPCTLGGATSLQQVLVDVDTLMSPPSSVAARGTTAILQYLCLQNGTSFVPNRDVPQCQPEDGEKKSNLKDSFNFLEKKKEDKLKEFKEVERMLQVKKGREFELHEHTKQDKSKLLLQLVEQQKKTEEDVTRFQIQREQERTRLLAYLLKVEKEAEEAISDLLAVSQAVQRSSTWQQQEQHLLTTIKTHTLELHRKQVIDAMETLLAEECARKEKFLAYEKSKAEVIKNSLVREVEWSQQVCELVRERDIRQTTLLSAIREDTKLHKAMVATLLERSDLRTQSLLLQTSLVQQQLAALTAAELQSRDQHSVDHVNELAEKRQRLSEMLVGLLHEQEVRRKHLIETQHQLEAACSTQVSENSPDYWLWQYQCLLDLNVPHLTTTAKLEPDLVHDLVAAGVAHCLPFLACCPLSSLTPELLVQVGIKNEEERAVIIQVVRGHLKRREAQLSPSAPPEELPSAPPLSPSSSLPECIICMALECAVVFVPCGHLCACAGCAAQLLLCPLCRAPLDRKIHIIVP